MMKKKIFCATVLLLVLFQEADSQTINFNNLKKEERHIASLQAGLEYGLVCGMGYGYQLKSKKPIILNIEFSSPAGENQFDDFKTRLGGEITFCRSGNFYVSGKVHGLYRQNQNDYVTLQNFGADVSGTAGYYKRKWFAALDLGFDKAIVTRFKHSASYKAIYPDVRDGWYEPATGGNFHFGLLAGYSFKRSDLYLKGGKLAAQDFSNPLLPFYTQIGYTIRFQSRH